MPLADTLTSSIAKSDTATVVVGIILVFSLFLFSSLFLRRWTIPRMGYFLITVIVIFVRARDPEELFYQAVAFTAGLFSMLMFGLAHKNLDFDSRKEPMYFLFNGFALLVLTLPMNPYLFFVSSVSVIASLFFLVSKKPGGHRKSGNLSADEKIMEKLERKAGRKT